MKKLKFCLFFAFLIISLSFIAQTALATPNISGVSGTVSNGSQITITGSGFGANGPTIEVFDDFQAGTVGNQIGLNLAPVGQWDGVFDEVRYSSDYYHSGTKSCKLNFNYITYYPWLQSLFVVGDGQEIFFSWWQYLPTDKDVPGTNHPDSPNWKLFWLYDWVDDYFRSDYVITILTNSLPGSTAFGLGSEPNRTGMWLDDGIWVDNFFRKGEWCRYWSWWKGGQSSNGAAYIKQMQVTDGMNTIVSDTNIKNQSDGYPWKKLHFPGYGRHDTNSIAYFDDIYVAIGYAQARVEIGNNATYANNTNLTILTSTSWSDTAITATVRQGSFTNGQAYLYVFDSNGNVNTNGYSITIGSGQPPDTTPPAPPSGVTVS